MHRIFDLVHRHHMPATWFANVFPPYLQSKERKTNWWTIRVRIVAGKGSGLALKPNWYDLRKGEDEERNEGNNFRGLSFQRLPMSAECQGILQQWLTNYSKRRWQKSYVASSCYFCCNYRISGLLVGFFMDWTFRLRLVAGLAGPATGLPLRNLVRKVELRKPKSELRNSFPSNISWRKTFPMN